jgi:hypothetical protein
MGSGLAEVELKNRHEAELACEVALDRLCTPLQAPPSRSTPMQIQILLKATLTVDFGSKINHESQTLSYLIEDFNVNGVHRITLKRARQK